MTRGQRFEPDRLPDARGRRVEDALGRVRPMLLTARQRPVGQGVRGTDDDHVAAPSGGPRDVGAEGAVTAFVTRHLDVVDPDGGPVIDSAEMKDEPLRLRSVERAPVPEHVARAAARSRRAPIRGRTGR